MTCERAPPRTLDADADPDPAAPVDRACREPTVLDPERRLGQIQTVLDKWVPIRKVAKNPMMDSPAPKAP